MSVFILKLIAVISMFIDHTTHVLHLSGRLPLGNLYLLGRTIGRPAFVIYCFLLVNGFEKTKDRKKYLSRLVLFAAISQIPFTLAFTAANYRVGAEAVFAFDSLRAFFLLLPLLAYYLTVCDRRFDASLLSLAAAFLLASVRLTVGGICLLDPEDVNVFYTLSSSFAVMLALSYLRSEESEPLRAFLILAALTVELYFLQQHADYGLLGAALIVGMYLCRGRRWMQLGVAALWAFIEYRWCIFDYPRYLPYFLGALSALLPLALYNGKLGRKMRSFFYVFYPAHLTLLGAVFFLLSRA